VFDCVDFLSRIGLDLGYCNGVVLFFQIIIIIWLFQFYEIACLG